MITSGRSESPKPSVNLGVHLLLCVVAGVPTIFNHGNVLKTRRKCTNEHKHKYTENSSSKKKKKRVNCIKCPALHINDRLSHKLPI